MFRSSLVAGCLITLTLAPTAARQPTQAQRDAVRASCRSDFMANCASVQPGSKEALGCLLRNESKLSAPCRSAVSAIASPSSAAAPAPAPAATPAPSDASPPAQTQSSMPAAAVAPTTTSHPASAPPRKMRATSTSARLPLQRPADRRQDQPRRWPWRHLADTANAAAKGAYDPRAMPPRAVKIMCGSARRRRQNPFLPCRECAATVANLLRGVGASE